MIRYFWCMKCETEWKNAENKYGQPCPECKSDQDVMSSKWHRDERLIAQMATELYEWTVPAHKHIRTCEAVELARIVLAETRKQLAEEK